MDFKDLGVGIDIEEVQRFEKYDTANNPFVLRIFTKNEIEYCFSKKNYAAHLAARYCAKEACLKAVCSFGYEAVSYADFEIFHAKNGAPEVKILNPNLENKVEIKVSISHNKLNAICYALAHKKHIEINYNENSFINNDFEDNYDAKADDYREDLRRDVYGSAEI